MDRGKPRVAVGFAKIFQMFNPRLKTHFHSLDCSGEDAGNQE
jgi:hypothetical protein